MDPARMLASPGPACSTAGSVEVADSPALALIILMTRLYGWLGLRFWVKVLRALNAVLKNDGVIGQSQTVSSAKVADRPGVALIILMTRLPEDMPPPRIRKRARLSEKVLASVVITDPGNPLQVSEISNGGGDLSDCELSDIEDSLEQSSANSKDSYHTAKSPPGAMSSVGDNGFQLRRLQSAVQGVKYEETSEESLSLSYGIGSSTNGTPQTTPTQGSNGVEPSPQISQEMRERLVRIYITREYVNLPIFDLPEFQATCNDSNTTSKPFEGMLNTIFALSGLSTSDMDDTMIASLFSRGHRLTRDMDYRGNPWQRVQAHILQSQYFYATRKAKLAWVSLGFAIRTAQVLDVQTMTGGQDPRQRRSQELARRLWHSAMIMERILALQLGLQPQNSDVHRIPLPTHLDTDYLDTISGGEPVTNGERPSIVEFLSSCSRLYQHVEDIMAWETELRMRPNNCAAKKLLTLDFQPFLKVDGLLYDWQTSLPFCLHSNTPADPWEEPIARRQRNILRVRYLYVRLRLYRPLMILGLALTTKCGCRPGGTPHLTDEDLGSPDIPTTWNLVRDSSIKCVAAATELVNILETNEDGLLDGGPHDSHRSPIPSYGENIDYLYACGTILLAARLCPFTRRSQQSSRNACWRDLLELLKQYQGMRSSGRVREVAKTCRDTLKGLAETVAKSPNVATVNKAVVIEDDIGTEDPQPAVTDLPQNRGVKRRRLGSNVRRHEYFEWVDSLPIELVDGMA
ncbi:hypothetical protein FE257_007058 [Aspergillus nanangensis]|uniref:Xylanolytic transcriptional activator regulatory domain-containing protein n=1 Tax=Aspergillus nanangensis TaxID=2582783 RepID=A0AAD4GUH8_ASPNN|nr:hypothetical protein FE257_007058 [Aspergillus nanangensis]